MVEAAMNDPTALEALDLTVYTRHLADRGDLTAEKVGFRMLRCSSKLCRGWTSAPGRSHASLLGSWVARARHASLDSSGQEHLIRLAPCVSGQAASATGAWHSEGCRLFRMFPGRCARRTAPCCRAGPEPERDGGPAHGAAGAVRRAAPRARPAPGAQPDVRLITAHLPCLLASYAAPNATVLRA
jgi:hypothetical protein